MDRHRVAVCGTPGALAQVQGGISELAQGIGRPILDHSYLSPTTRFLIHYDTTFENSASRKTYQLKNVNQQMRAMTEDKNG